MVGICEVCGTQINKAITPNKIDFYKNIFNVEMVHAENLIEYANTSATSKKNKELKMAKFNAENERLKRKYLEWKKRLMA